MIWLVQSLRQIDLVIENGASLFDFLYCISAIAQWSLSGLFVNTFIIAFLLLIYISFYLHKNNETKKTKTRVLRPGPP